MQVDPHVLWNEFFLRHHLNSVQQEYFKEYYNRLVSTNALHNITAILDLNKVIEDHFNDSLALADFIDCTNIKRLGDIGSGGGFPSIPLKILYPHLSLVLIEVNAKKRTFLNELISAFNLTDTVVSEYDWRTFLRKTDYQIDYFCARASLLPEELIRVFMPSSPYKKGSLVYWATGHWKPTDIVAPYLYDSYNYHIDTGLERKERKLVRFIASST